MNNEKFMMIPMIRKRLIRILEVLTSNPENEYSLTELAKETKTSKAFVMQAVNELEREKLVETRRLGNIRLVKLSKNRKTMLFKSWYFAQKLLDLGVEKIARNYISLALFGSHAKGEYDNKSDIDLLIVGPVSRRDINMKIVSKIERNTKKALDIKIYSFGEWEKMKQSCDKFALNILGSYILLGGEPL